MGRAIEMEKRLDALEFKVNEILLMLDELANTNTTQEHIDLHEETKEEANDKGSKGSSGKSDKGKSTAKAKSSKDSGSSK